MRDKVQACGTWKTSPLTMPNISRQRWLILVSHCYVSHVPFPHPCQSFWFGIKPYYLMTTTECPRTHASLCLCSSTFRFYLMYDTTEIVFYVIIASRINLKVFHLYHRTFDLWRAHHQALLIKPNYV
jgi:hypothetical protein